MIMTGCLARIVCGYRQVTFAQITSRQISSKSDQHFSASIGYENRKPTKMFPLTLQTQHLAGLIN